MSTQSPTTNRQAPYGEGPDQHGSYQPSNGRSRSRIWIAVIAAVVAAGGIVLGLVLSLGHSPSAAPATTGPSTSTSAPANPAVPANPNTPANPATPSHPVTPAQPSAAVMKLQQELGQLNYYEGPDNGIMTPQTVQAIKYLQRDAHLPQTGVMNAATQAALANFLAHGNSQMGG
jgi:hypothetical protein